MLKITFELLVNNLAYITLDISLKTKTFRNSKNKRTKSIENLDLID